MVRWPVALVAWLAATGVAWSQSEPEPTPQDPYQPGSGDAAPTTPPPPPPDGAGPRPPQPPGPQGSQGQGPRGQPSGAPAVGVEPRVPHEPTSDASDFSGHLGFVLYQQRSAFENRDAGFSIGAERQRIVSELLYLGWDAEIGLSGDSDDRDNSGFRMRADYLVGIAFARTSGYVALAAGLGFNGESDAIPVALTLPVELRVGQWLAPEVRGSAYLRADRFVAAYDSREDAADGYWQFDELSGGFELGFMRTRDDGDAWAGGERPNMKGFTVGVGYHRTMGSGVLLFNIGVIASTIPIAGR